MSEQSTSYLDLTIGAILPMDSISVVEKSPFLQPPESEVFDKTPASAEMTFSQSPSNEEISIVQPRGSVIALLEQTPAIPEMTLGHPPSHEKISIVQPRSSVIVLLEQTPAIPEMTLGQPPSHEVISIAQSPGSEEILFVIDSLQSEDFWLDQFPDSEEFFFEELADFEKLKVSESPYWKEISLEETSESAVMTLGDERSQEEMSLEETSESAVMTLGDERSQEEMSLEETSESAVMTLGDEEMSLHQSLESAVWTENETRSKTNVGSINANESEENGKFQDKPVFFNKPSVNIKVNTNIKGSCNNVNMFVRPSSDKKLKKLCCPFCLKTLTKLARHMEIMHRKKPDVKKFSSLPKGSKERRWIQDALRKAGTFKWNTDSSLNKGELIPSRRPDKELNKEAFDFTSCPYCHGSYTKTNLRNHVARCHDNPMKNERSLTKLASNAEGRIDENASTRLANVISIMREYVIVRLIRYDWLLIVFGNKMCCKYTPHYQENMIRARLRLSGRVLYEIKKIDSNVTDFASIYHVERYNSLVSAIKIVGRFNPNTNEFGAPAMASCAVTFIKHIGKYLSAEYIRLRDRENKIETDDFLAYMETDIGISINKLVAETQSKMRRLKQQNIPTMEDVKILMRYINTELNACIVELSQSVTYANWLKLGQLCVAWIIVFNRRRTGEVQNILLSEFLGRETIDDESNQQMMATLSEDAKAVARKFKRMKIRGKKGRTVPALLKPSIDKAIRLLVSYRKAVGVSPRSQFLFELPSSIGTKTVDACQTLRKFSVLCGATNPSSLRGTNLRKHMATTCVSLELNDALVSEVADFMGHAEKIHREFYRQNTIDREVVQMAQLLETAVGKCDSDDDDDDDDDDHEDCGSNSDGVRGIVNNSDASGGNVGSEMINEPMVIDNNEDDMMMNDLQLNRSLNEFKDGTVDYGDLPKKKLTRRRWDPEEIYGVHAAFASHFKDGTLPKPLEVIKQQEKRPELRGRTWQQIKTWISNQKKKR